MQDIMEYHLGVNEVFPHEAYRYLLCQIVIKGTVGRRRACTYWFPQKEALGR